MAANNRRGKLGNAGNRSAHRYTGGRPPSSYIERNGERIAIKLDIDTLYTIELLALRRLQPPAQVVADAMAAERSKELAG